MHRVDLVDGALKTTRQRKRRHSQESRGKIADVKLHPAFCANQDRMGTPVKSKQPFVAPELGRINPTASKPQPMYADDHWMSKICYDIPRDDQAIPEVHTYTDRMSYDPGDEVEFHSTATAPNPSAPPGGRSGGGGGGGGEEADLIELMRRPGRRRWPPGRPADGSAR